MKKYAVIQNGQVINIIVASSKENAEAATANLCIDITEDTSTQIGYFYSNNQFSEYESE